MLSFASNPRISLSSREFRAFRALTVTFTDMLSQQLTGSKALTSRFTAEMTLMAGQTDSTTRYIMVSHGCGPSVVVLDVDRWTKRTRFVAPVAQTIRISGRCVSDLGSLWLVCPP